MTASFPFHSNKPFEGKSSLGHLLSPHPGRRTLKEQARRSAACSHGRTHHVLTLLSATFPATLGVLGLLGTAAELYPPESCRRLG